MSYIAHILSIIAVSLAATQVYAASGAKPVDLLHTGQPSALNNAIAVAWTGCPGFRAQASTYAGGLLICQTYLGSRLWVPYGSTNEDMERLGLGQYPSTLRCMIGTQLFSLKFSGKNNNSLFYDTASTVVTSDEPVATIALRGSVGRVGSTCYNLDSNHYTDLVKSGDAW